MSTPGFRCVTSVPSAPEIQALIWHVCRAQAKRELKVRGDLKCDSKELRKKKGEDKTGNKTGNMWAKWEGTGTGRGRDGDGDGDGGKGRRALNMVSVNSREKSRLGFFSQIYQSLPWSQQFLRIYARKVNRRIDLKSLSAWFFLSVFLSFFFLTVCYFCLQHWTLPSMLCCAPGLLLRCFIWSWSCFHWRLWQNSHWLQRMSDQVHYFQCHAGIRGTGYIHCAVGSGTLRQTRHMLQYRNGQEYAYQPNYFRTSAWEKEFPCQSAARELRPPLLQVTMTMV